MSKELFPKEIIENSQENNFSKHTVKSKIIYSTIVFSLIASLCLLPVIHVDVGVRSHGIIRPATKVVQLNTPVSGNIKELNFIENSFVEKGAIIAVVDSPQLSEKLRFNEKRTSQVLYFLRDLLLLQSFDINPEFEVTDLKSSKYQTNWFQFKESLNKHQHIIDQQKKRLDRQKALFERQVASKATLEEVEFSWNDALNQLQLLINQQKAKWKLEEITYRDEIERLKSEKAILQKDLQRFEIRAPINGTLHNRSGISQNSFVHANQMLGQISPDTSLIAELYVSPKDIGLLRENMQVRFQIDAFNYNEWGFASGHVKNISTDVVMNEGQPLFRVRCSIDQAYLELNNGFRGELKKGMTFQARFIVNRRNLFQLLYDSVDDWLNPSWNNNENLSMRNVTN
jgi:HlyD family secretion protein